MSVLRSAQQYDAAARLEKADPLANVIFDPYAFGSVAKADVTVGSLGDHSAVLQDATQGFFSNLESAGAKLISAGTKIQLGARSVVRFPRSDAAPTAASWVAEGAPIPVWEASLVADELGPTKKCAGMFVISRELASAPGGLAAFDALTREKAAATLDAAIFSADAGDDTKHAGLRYGLTPVASYGNPSDDVAALLADLGAKGGSGAAAIICHPVEHAIISTKLPNLSTPIWPSKALPQGVLVAVDLAAFCSSFAGFDILASEHGAVHMSDTPLEIVSGTGPTTADPVRSLWQTGTIGIRLIVELAFCARGGLVSCMEGVSWI
ncbi:hypothetical protein ACNHKD_12715 [Methylocystis sp. JAN1]|uniref:hypothetical protein n=1 Tax=Methylocystis sp. JAN1 TaxID=3397211 RepID=UPI003FA1F2A6